VPAGGPAILELVGSGATGHVFVAGAGAGHIRRSPQATPATSPSPATSITTGSSPPFSPTLTPTPDQKGSGITGSKKPLMQGPLPQGAAAEPNHVPGLGHLPQRPLRQPQRRAWAEWHRDRVLARCSGASGVRPPDATTTSSWLRSISPTLPHSTPTLPSRVSGATTLAGGVCPRTSTQI